MNNNKTIQTSGELFHMNNHYRNVSVLKNKDFIVMDSKTSNGMLFVNSISTLEGEFDCGNTIINGEEIFTYKVPKPTQFWLFYLAVRMAANITYMAVRPGEVNR